MEIIYKNVAKIRRTIERFGGEASVREISQDLNLKTTPLIKTLESMNDVKKSSGLGIDSRWKIIKN